MKKISKGLMLSLVLATGLSSLAVTNSANAATVIRKCWVNYNGVQRCKVVRVKRYYPRRHCRRYGCYRPRYYSAPIIIGPVIRPPVIRFGW